MRNVLLLNADYTPLKILKWERAVELLLDEKAIAVEPYPETFVRSEKLALPWPAVIALKRYRTLRQRVKFSARNVQARDGWRCSYCGAAPRTRDGRPDRSQLTLDHVIPRAQAEHNVVYLPWAKKWTNVTCWENSATACRACNARKADRTPQEARMTLRVVPRLPTQSDVLRMTLSRLRSVPEQWRQYLPDASVVGWGPAKQELDDAAVEKTS